MLEVFVAEVSAFLEPSAATIATTAFAVFIDTTLGASVAAYSLYCRWSYRRVYLYAHIGVDITHAKETRVPQLIGHYIVLFKQAE